MTSNHLLLYRIAELMLANGRHVLSVDDLFDDEKIGDFVKSIQIDSPYQQMLYEGVLTETVKDEQLHVTFTVEGYFHYMLGEVIYDQSEGKGANFLISLLNDSRLKGIKEGIEQCLIRDIIRQQLERLISFIDSGGDYLEICIRPLLYFMKGYGVEYTLNKLLENPTDNDWQALLKLNELLDKLQLQVLRKELLNIVISRISFTNKYDTQLGLKAIAVIDDEQARMHYARINVNAEFIQNYSTIFNSIGDCSKRFGEYDMALEYYEKCLAIELKTLGSEHPSVAISYNNIGSVWKRKGEYEKALEYYEKSMGIKLKTLGSEHPSVAISYNDIGSVWKNKGEYEKALEYYEKSIGIKLKTLGSEHSSVAISYNDIGSVWKNKGEYEKALEYYEKSMGIKLKTLGSEHSSVAISYNDIGLVWQNKGEYEKALGYYEKSLEIDLKILGVAHPHVATSYNNIGLVWQYKGEYDKALEYYEKSLEIWLKTLGNEHPSVARSYNNIGSILNEMGSYEKALEYFQKSLENFIIKLGVDHPNVSYPYKNMGLTWSNMGDYDKAIEYFQKSLNIRLNKYGKGDSRTKESIGYVKDMYQKLGKENEIPDWMNEI